MKTPSYRDRDYVFGKVMLTLRITLGLTQGGLAAYLGVSRHAVSLWEAGSSYPKADNLKELIALAIKNHGFEEGREVEEIRQLWKASRQKTWLNETWLAEMLAQTAPEPPTILAARANDTGSQTPVLPPKEGPQVDWGEALAVPTFFGREWELGVLKEWVVDERCRVISVLGMGGIGKSTLTVKLMHRVANNFEVVIWRSLRDTPDIETLLDGCLQVLASQLLEEASSSLERRLSLLLEQLRNRRVLLILDNLETLLEDGEGSNSQMRAGYEGYSRLLERFAGTAHQSCLVLTSREKPADLMSLEGNRSPVRVLRLARLGLEACVKLLTEQDASGSDSDLTHLIEAYAGNPLALKIVGRTIVDLFGGEIPLFLAEGEIIFGGVRELLNNQFARLSDLGQSILLWLAIMREPSTIEELSKVLVAPVPRDRLLEAIEGLHRHSLIEHGQKQGSFTLQSVVLEYATSRLIENAREEILKRQLKLLIEHGLALAGSREYVRQTQERLLVAPILAYLGKLYQQPGRLEKHLVALIAELANQAEAGGYGPANLLVLLRLLRGHLRGLDLSRLGLREAYLQGVEMQDTKLAGAIVRDCVFTETFDIPWAVAVSPNGQYWATGSRRGEICIWREEGKVLYLAWMAHTDTIRTLAFSPTGNTLASGSWDGTTRLWDLENAALLWTHWFTDNIEILAFAPDGRTLASAGGDSTVRLLDAASGAHLTTLSGHSGSVFALAWSPTGTLIASAGTDKEIRLWELSENYLESSSQLLEGHTNWILGLAFAPDGLTLASASWDTTVRLWNMTTKSLSQVLSGHSERLRALAWSPNGRLLASCGFDHTIWLWDTARNSYQVGLRGHSAGVYSIAFLPDSNTLLSGSEDGTLRVWDTLKGLSTFTKQGYATSLYDLAWSPDGTQIASAGSNRLVTIQDIEGRTPGRLLRSHRSMVLGVAWSPDGRFLASCGLDSAIRLWDSTNGEVRQTLQDPDHTNTLFYSVQWSPDGTRLATSSYYRGVQIWEVTTGTGRWAIPAQPTRNRHIEWSPDGTQLASCGDDGSVWLWQADDLSVSTLLSGHRGRVMNLAWSPDGKRLASAGGRNSGEIIIWDVPRRRRLQSWDEPEAVVYSLTWSKNGLQLIIGRSDGKIRWLDARDGKCLMERQGQQGAVQSLRLSPDGTQLASCGDDNIIRLWNSESGDQLQELLRDRPYDRLDITGIQGLTDRQKATLRALGAIEVSVRI